MAENTAGPMTEKTAGFMAERTGDHSGDNSPEQVAYRLLHEIAQVERIALNSGDLEPRWTRAGRAWILDTYQECLYAVTNPKRPAHLK